MAHWSLLWEPHYKSAPHVLWTPTNLLCHSQQVPTDWDLLVGCPLSDPTTWITGASNSGLMFQTSFLGIRLTVQRSADLQALWGEVLIEVNTHCNGPFPKYILIALSCLPYAMLKSMVGLLTLISELINGKGWQERTCSDHFSPQKTKCRDSLFYMFPILNDTRMWEYPVAGRVCVRSCKVLISYFSLLENCVCSVNLPTDWLNYLL